MSSSDLKCGLAPDARGRSGMKVSYEAPKIEDFGSIADHTFNNPGKGDKSATPMETDTFGEFSHPFTSP
jgi:hypothetical protein